MMRFKVSFVTARSFVLEMQDSEADYETESYDIYVNGEKVMTSVKTIESVYGLSPDTEYKVYVGRGKETSAAVSVKTNYEYVTLNVRDFGAKGDGVSDDTAKIQAAILTAPENSRVYIPAGTFRFTNLFLKSNLTLELAKDAVLLALPEKEKYPVLPGRIESYDETDEFLPGSWEGTPIDSFASILTGMYVENVVVCGQGIIDGCADFDNWWNVEKRKGDPARPRMLFLNHCKNFVMQGVTIRNSPAWNLHPFYSEELRFLDLKIFSPSNSHNTDGLDPESCTNVEIAGIYFSVGDDCIAVKSGKMYMAQKYKRPSRHIVIHHCLMEKGHGAVTIGSEIASGVDDIRIQNCHFVGTDRGLRVKTRRGRGRDSYLQNISFQNVTMDKVRSAFVINSFYYCGSDGKTDYVASTTPLPVDERTPRVGTISIRDVVCRDCEVAGIYFYGLPESRIEKVEMENVDIRFAKEVRPGKAAMMRECEPASRQGVFIRNVSKVFLNNVTLEGTAGEPMNIKGVGELDVQMADDLGSWQRTS